MFRSLMLWILLVICLAPLYAQGTLKITTDKSTYLYGDSIQVKVTITNHTDSTFTLRGSTTCIVGIGFNSVSFMVYCTADDRDFVFTPGMSRAWSWNLKPSELGIPDQDSIQHIYGYSNGMSDSVIIKAPKYYGGRLYAHFKSGVSSLELQGLRDSFNVTVLARYAFPNDTSFSEVWQVIHHSVDSAVTVLSKDPRIKAIAATRVLNIKEEPPTTGLANDEVKFIPEVFFLGQNYPNPFNPVTTISYSLPERLFTELKVYDLLGHKVLTLVNKEQSSGEYKVQFDGSSLSSGVYIYTLKSGSFRDSKKLLLLK